MALNLNTYTLQTLTFEWRGWFRKNKTKQNNRNKIKENKIKQILKKMTKSQEKTSNPLVTFFQYTKTNKQTNKQQQQEKANSIL